MASVAVNNLAEAMIVVARLLNEMKSRGSVGDLIGSVRREVETVQTQVWDSGLGFHAPSTVAARADRTGYYGRVRPNGRARPDRPYLEWSGKLREAASTLTKVNSGRGTAEIDADRNYRGPIKSRQAFTDAVLRRVPESVIYPMPAIEKRIEQVVLEPWAERVARIVARRGA